MRVVVRLADKCNLKCKFCCAGWSNQSNHLSDMSLIDFNLILEKLRIARIHGQRVTELRLDGDREGLCYPQLAEAVVMTKRAGFTASLISNAVLFTSETACNLLNAGLDNIEFSVSGITVNTYSRFQGYDMPEGQFDKVVCNIRDFVYARKQLDADCNISVHMIMDETMANNADEYRDAIKFWGEVGIKSVNVLSEIDISVKDKEIDVIGGPRCFDAPVIAPNGDVYPCCGNPGGVIIGNILTDTPESVFEDGSKILALKRAVKQGKGFPAGCGQCAKKINYEPYSKTWLLNSENIQHLTRGGFDEFCSFAKSKQCFIFGSGDLTRKAIVNCREANINIEGIIDNNFRLWGDTIDGVPIIEPSYCQNLNFNDCALLLCNRNIADASILVTKLGFVHIWAYGFFFEQAYKQHKMFRYFFKFEK